MAEAKNETPEVNEDGNEVVETPTSIADTSVSMPDTYHDDKAGVDRIATPGNTGWEGDDVEPDPDEVKRLDELGFNDDVDKKGSKK